MFFDGMFFGGLFFGGRLACVLDDGVGGFALVERLFVLRDVRPTLWIMVPMLEADSSIANISIFSSLIRFDRMSPLFCGPTIQHAA